MVIVGATHASPLPSLGLSKRLAKLGVDILPTLGILPTILTGKQDVFPTRVKTDAQSASSDLRK